MIEGSAAFAPLSEFELQEWMALETFDGPIGQARDDLNLANVVQAVGSKARPLYECKPIWDADEWEQYQQEKLRRTFTGKNR